MSWRETTLGEITDLKRGFDLPKSQRLQGDVPVYSSSGITGSNSTAAVEGPCVITGRYGTIGEVFFSGGPCWPLNTALYSTEFNGNNPRFIYYLLQTIPWQGYTTASAVPGVNRNHVNLCPVKIPDRATQDAIVEVLDSIVDKIALNNRLNDYLADLCETIAGKYCNDRNSCLRDICYQVTDHVDYGNANQETYVSTESLMQNKGGRQLASSLPTTGKITRYRIGDTLISNIRPYFKKIWYAPFEGTCSGDVIVFRANDPSNAPYLHACLRQDSFFDYVMQGAKGTKMPRGDKKQMMEFKVASSCSTKDLILLDSAIKQRSDNDSETVKLQALRDTLLPKLMSGEIDVSKVDLTQLTNNHLLVRGHNVPNRYWKEHLWKPSLIVFCRRCRTCLIRHSSNIWPKYSESRCCQLRKHQRRRIC